MKASFFGATDRTRTGTNKSRDFKSLAATNYATVANLVTIIYHKVFIVKLIYS